MASRYFCYRCRDNGWPTEEVIFGGKDEQGKTILKNPDNSLHQHKSKPAQQSRGTNAATQTQQPTEQQQQHSQIPEILSKLQGLEAKINDLHIKINHILKMFEDGRSFQTKREQDFDKDRNLIDNR